MKYRQIGYFTMPLILILSMGILFDDVKSQRVFLLMTMSALIILISIILPKLNEKYILLTLCIQVVFISILEYHSRYIVNYFFHASYFIVLINSARFLKQKRLFILSLLTILLSMTKYIYLLRVSWSIGNLSQAVFLGLISIFVAVSLYLFKRIEYEKNQREILYKALLETHRKLKQSSEKLVKMAALQERTDIARDIHDTIGHDLIGTLMELEMTKQMTEIEAIKNAIDRANSNIKASLNGIRTVVSTLRQSEVCYTYYDVVTLIDAFEYRSGLKVYFELPHPKSLSEQGWTLIYRMIQESMTNTAKYAEATYIDIVFKQNADTHKVTFTLYDDGKGSCSIKGGFGLQGMGERLLKMGGKMQICGEQGFEIKGWFLDETRCD